MKNLFLLFIRYKFLVLALFFTIVLFGYRAYKEIPIDAFPDITPKQVVIYTESPGNSGEDIEKIITYPIESAMSGLAGVKTIVSNSLFGLSYVSIFFEDRYDINLLRQLVSERLNSIDIPKGWGKPTLGPNTTGLGQVFWYQLKDNTNSYSLAELRELNQYIVAPMLKSLKGVEEVTSWGGFDKQYEVLIDPFRLQAVGVTYNEVIQALQKSNQSAGGQYLEFNREQYLIRGAGLYESLDDIKNSIIKSEGVKTVKIADVAKVQIGKAPRFGAVSIDGKEAMFGMVLQRSGTNASEVSKLIKEKLSTIHKALPKGVEIKAIYDRSEITYKAVSTMINAVAIGSVFVAIVLFLFLFEFTTAFIVITALPISLLIAFLLMRYFGISSNLMSLSGLAIAIGMIVDGTIVVVENSFRVLALNPNLSKEEVIVNATYDVAKPVFYALLIIAAVFIPLLSLDGLAGKLYTPMAINIVFVMLGSLLVALVLVPVLSYLFLKPTKLYESPLIKGIKKIYIPILRFALNYAKSLALFMVIVSAILVYILSIHGREFMPSLNEESIMYRVIAIPGTSLSQSIKTAKSIEKFLLKKYQNDVDSVLSMIGRSEKGESAQANYMEILLTLKPNIKNIKSLGKKITESLKDRFEYVQFVPTQPIAMRIEELLEGVSAELAIKIYGKDQKIMQQIASNIESVVEGTEGLEHAELEVQLGQAEIVIKPDYLALARYGFDVSDVMNIIRYGIGEDSVTQKIEGVRRFGIVAKIEGAKNSIDSISEILLRSKNGKVVKLNQLCSIDIRHGPSFIKREDLSRYIVLSMEVENRDIASFVEEVNKKIKEHVELPSGYYIKWAGDFKNMQQATNKLIMIIPITIGIILLLLNMAFNSFKKSFLILLALPLGLVGGIVGLLLSGEYLSVSAIVGFIVIFAIAILNGIVLVSFIDELRKKEPDRDLKDLLEKAAVLRLRPVLMTAFTTLFGILPLLFSTGVGSEIQYPLSVVVTGGIISSTLLTLVLLPGLYLLFYSKRA